MCWCIEKKVLSDTRTGASLKPGNTVHRLEAANATGEGHTEDDEGEEFERYPNINWSFEPDYIDRQFVGWDLEANSAIALALKSPLCQLKGFAPS